MWCWSVPARATASSTARRWGAMPPSWRSGNCTRPSRASASPPRPKRRIAPSTERAGRERLLALAPGGAGREVHPPALADDAAAEPALHQLVAEQGEDPIAEEDRPGIAVPVG